MSTFKNFIVHFVITMIIVAILGFSAKNYACKVLSSEGGLSDSE